MFKRLIFIIFLLLTNQLFSQTKFEQKGFASYYADKFQGRYTSSGEKFDQNKFTAAHAFLPFNTWVKVTRLSSKKSIVVKINDRCMRSKSRIIDLSKSAAQELNITSAGIADVIIETVKDSSGSPIIQDTLSRTSTQLQNLNCFYSKDFMVSSPKGYGVQIISIKNTDSLLTAINKYNLKFKETINIRTKYFKTDKYYIVILGEYNNKDDAAILQRKLVYDFSDCMIVNFNEL